MPSFPIPPVAQNQFGSPISGNPAAPWGGVDLLHDPRVLAVNHLALAKNVAPVRAGILSKRGAIQFQRRSVSNPDPLAQPIGSIATPFFGDSRFVFAYRNGALGQFCLEGITLFNSSTNLLVNPIGKLPMVAFNGNVIASVGPTPNIQAMDPYGGNPNYRAGVQFGSNVAWIGVAQPAGQNTPGVSVGFQTKCAGWNFVDAAGTALRCVDAGLGAPAVIAVYNDRLVFLNFGPGNTMQALFGDSISPGRSSATAANKPFTVAATGASLTSRMFPIAGARDSDTIVAAVEILLTSIGSAPQKGLLVLCSKSAYLLTGEPNQSTDVQATFPPIGNLSIARVAFNPSCASAETVATTPYGTIWAGQDDVWFFPTGQVPYRIGSKIRPALLRTPAQFRYRWHATYFDGFYRLAVDAPGAAFSDTLPCGEQYWLDLRDGPPQGGESVDSASDAKWWGPMTYNFSTSAGVTQVGTNSMFAMTDLAGRPGLFGIEQGFATSQGLNLVQYDVPNNRDSASDATLAQGSDTGSEILVDIRTKEYDLGDPMVDKIIKGMEVNLFTDEDAILNLDIIMDGGAVVDTQLKSIQSNPFSLDIDTLNALVGRKTQSIFIPADPTTRDIAKTFQFRLYDVAGVVVIAGVNDTFVWGEHSTFNGGLPNWAIAVTIPPGYYATVAALATALTNAMTANSMAASNYALSSYPININTGNLSRRWWPAFADTDFSGLNPPTQLANGAIFSAGAFSAAQYRSTKKLWAMMGMDTGSSGISQSLWTHTGTAVYQATTPIWEFGRLAMDVGTIPRRPI